MTIAERAIKLHTSGAKQLEVTPDEYMELMCDYRVSTIPNKPSPPVKSRTVNTGFFSSHTTTEYDNSAPEYLEALDKWREECDKARNSPPRFMGLEVVLKT